MNVDNSIMQHGDELLRCYSIIGPQVLQSSMKHDSTNAVIYLLKSTWLYYMNERSSTCLAKDCFIIDSIQHRLIMQM